MTNSEIIEQLDSIVGTYEILVGNGVNSDILGIDDIEALREAIKALKADPCENTISRQAAIDLADELKDDLPDNDRLSYMVMSHNEGILEYQTKLSLLPPVTPAEKVGRWIKDESSSIAYRCTVCNTLQHWSVIQQGRYHFCPNCGAKMQEVK